MHDTEAGSPAAILSHVAAQLGLDAAGARPLRLHDASTFLLPVEELVLRLNTASGETLGRAMKALQLTAWLATRDFPAVRPAITEPVTIDDRVVTVWHAVAPRPPGTSRGVHTALGRLVKDLHQLPDPPVVLPAADPLARLRAALDIDSRRAQPVLNGGDHGFLAHRVQDLDAQYRLLTFPLGVGLIHNDAHPGNVLPASAAKYGYLLTDWEGACIGPREMDVVLTGAPGSRFGDAEEDRLAFSAAYGYDITTWPPYQILRDIRDLHSLAGHIRAAPNYLAARNELSIRIRSLREDDRTVRWRAV